MNPSSTLSAEELSHVQKLRATYDLIRKELGKRIVGQDAVLEQFLTCFFAGGHSLLIGVPGLAKTLMIKSMAQILSLSFSRIQFTPDLLPSDIVGTDVIVEDRATKQRHTKFLRGPIFANILLADEINRTPPKTQAALLEAMEEQTVTVGGVPNPMDLPFFVLATQNPIEQEGTYPLPVAALDRFMFNIYVDYPTPAEEREIVKMSLPFRNDSLETLLPKEEIIALLDIVRRVNATEEVLQFATTLVRSSRPKSGVCPDDVKEFLHWGASPRGVQCLIIAGKSRAMLHGRNAVSVEDVVAVAKPVMRHRIILNYHAEAEGKTADWIIERLIRHATGAPEPQERKPTFWSRIQRTFGRKEPAAATV